MKSRIQNECQKGPFWGWLNGWGLRVRATHGTAGPAVSQQGPMPKGSCTRLIYPRVACNLACFDPFHSLTQSTSKEHFDSFPFYLRAVDNISKMRQTSTVNLGPHQRCFQLGSIAPKSGSVWQEYQISLCIHVSMGHANGASPNPVVGELPTPA